jgi:hypothetical protein
MRKFPPCNKLKDLNANLKQEMKGSEVYQQFNESTSSDLVKKIK